MPLNPKIKYPVYKHNVFIDTWLDPIYTTRYWVVIADDLEGFSSGYKELLGRQDYNPKETAAAFTEDFIDKDGYFNVLIFFIRKATYSIVTHECVHAVNMTFKHHGMKLDVDNDEHQAYYTGHLVNKCLTAFDTEDKLRTKKQEAEGHGKAVKKTTKRKSKTK